jgi:hypothetical protein
MLSNEGGVLSLELSGHELGLRFALYYFFNLVIHGCKLLLLVIDFKLVLF